MLIGEVIQRIQSLYSHGVQSSASRLTNQHIYNKLCTVRVLLLSQKVRKRQKISEWSYQIIPCIPLILASINECPCPLPENGKLLRTKEKIPKPILSIDGEIIQVTSIDGSQNYGKLEFVAAKFAKGNKYTAFKSNSILRNEYVFITDNRVLEIISIKGLFEDPIAVERYKLACNCDEPVYDCTSNLDLEFNIDGDLIEPLIALTAEELVKDFYNSAEDRFNDAADNNSKVAK